MFALPAPAAPPPTHDKRLQALWAREQRRMRHRLQVLGMVLGGYAVDAAILLAFATTGVIGPEVGWAYAGTGLSACALFFALLHTRWCDRHSEPYLVVPQMLAGVAITAAFVVWVPQIGGLLLALLLVMFAFAAQRMSLQHALLGALATAMLVAVVLALAGERVALPLSDGPERALSALWFAQVLARSALLGVYAETMRSLLVKRKALLEDSVERLELLASRDELTGALNRRSVLRLLDEERERMHRTGQPFGVALLDIDHFKQVNEVYGHRVGDEVLRRFSLMVAAEMRTTDRLGRCGGEEFLLLLTAVTDFAAATAVTGRVRAAVASHNWGSLLPGQRLTLSAGVTMCREGESIEQTLARADLALCQAKHDGRNCVRSA
jgi:diguanylate cyclase (GGDEF)-like protein